MGGLNLGSGGGRSGQTFTSFTLKAELIRSDRFYLNITERGVRNDSKDFGLEG